MPSSLQLYIFIQESADSPNRVTITSLGAFRCHFRRELSACRHWVVRHKSYFSTTNLLSLLATHYLQARKAWSLPSGKSGFDSISPKDKLLVCRFLDENISDQVFKTVSSNQPSVFQRWVGFLLHPFYCASAGSTSSSVVVGTRPSSHVSFH